MASTANLRGTKLETGQAQKEATINGLFDLLDAAGHGKLDVTITTANVTLTGTPAAPQAQNKFFNLSGTLTGNRDLIFPVNDDDPATGNPRVIVVKNGTAGAFTVTVKVSGQTGVTVTQGTTAILLHNGTDFIKLVEVNSSSLVTNVSGSTATWARAYHNADQSLSNITLTAIALNSERNDTDVIHDTSTNNSRLTCKTAGVYLIVGQLTYAANATGIRKCAIRFNGTTYIGNQDNLNSGASLACPVSTATIYPMAVNDYVEMVGYQDSGGSLNVMTAPGGDQYSPELMMVRLGS